MKFNSRVFILALIAYSIVAFYTEGYFHPDEHYQLIEFAGSKTGHTKEKDLAWEYQEQMRPTLQPWIAYITLSALQIFTSNPFSQLFFLRLLTGILAVLSIRYFIKQSQFEIRESLQPAYTLFSYFLWFTPLILTRFSSESWSTIALIITVSLAINPKPLTRTKAAMLGITIGLAFLFRFQTSVIGISILLWLIVIKKEKLKNITLIVSFGLLLVFVGVMLDSLFYGNLVFSPWNYFRANILEGVASSMGTAPFYFYIKTILKYTLLPIGIILFISILFFGVKKTKHLYTWCIFSFLIIHSLIAHKERRFIFSIAFFAAPIVLITYQYFRDVIAQKVPKKIVASLGLLLILSVVFTNFIGFAGVLLNPAGKIHMGNRIYIHDAFPNKPVQLIYVRNSAPHVQKILPLSYYEQDNINTIYIDDLCTLQNSLLKDPNATYLISISRKDLANNKCSERLKNFKLTQVYQIWPDWIDYLNSYYNLFRAEQFTRLYEIEMK